MDIIQRKSAVLVSPVRTLAWIMALTALRVLVGLVTTVAIVGPASLPLVIPAIFAVTACARAACAFRPAFARLGLCMSAAMWIGAASAVVSHEQTRATVFLAAVIVTFAVADVLLGTMTVGRVE